MSMMSSVVCLTTVCFPRSRYTGKERDAESGNDYFGARYYASSMGRFMSPDPSGLSYADPTNPQSLNLYSYVLNNPLHNIDPSGEECVWDDGSYDASDDPDTGSSDKCTGQGGTWIPPDIFEGVQGNQAGSWSGQASSSIASNWLNPSTTVYGGPNAAAQEVDEALGYFFGSGAKPTIIYQPNDPFTLEFQQSLAMQGILTRISADCSKTTGAAPVGHWEAFVNTMIDGLMGGPGGNGTGFGTPEAQVGGFYSTYSISGGVVNITVQNPIDLNSLLYDHSSSLGIPNPTSGPTGSVNQILHIVAPNPCTNGH